MLCGSLSHDTVWAKSDIDLVLITIDDRKIEKSALNLYADGLNVHAFLLPRTAFRQAVEGSTANSFMHSLLAKGRLLYTHDDTITGLCARLHAIGDRDTQVQLLSAATQALGSLYKAHKWLLTREDLNYTALWLLYAATPLAKIEVLKAGLIVDREVIPQALKLNPALFKIIYTGLLNSKKTKKAVQAALALADEYIARRTTTLFAPVFEYLQEIGEARSATEIDDHFRRNYGIDGISNSCEYLADQGLIGKAPLAVRLTKRSNIDVEELAFFYIDPEPPDGF